ncbi:MAG: XdhC family protein [Desulfobulbaceae bacterium]|nr:XdhC family protein [Desulfobulbaceae bacterium]
MYDENTWVFIDTALEQGLRVCLITMVHAVGHGPNRPGCRLAVRVDGKLMGTVGGGNSEYTLINAALAALDGSRQPRSWLEILDHREHATENGSGMICSGTQTFALTCLDRPDRKVVQQIISARRNRTNGHIRLSVDGLSFSPVLTGTASDQKAAFTINPWCYVEPIGQVETVSIIGGGHVSLALSPLLFSLGMEVMVLDNRPGLPTMSDNGHAHQLRIVDYDDITSHIPKGDRSYVCIMTFGHEHDQRVLEQLVNQPLRYLGMMGSGPKIRQIRSNLLAKGISRQALDRVHAPIGLPIGSNTPGEIAISIAAEIVAVRRGYSSNPHKGVFHPF